VSDRGNRFILTLKEVVALPGIDTQQVAEELVDIFSRVGIQRREMLTDQVYFRPLSIRGLTSTPYFPNCNGLVERFNGIMKQLLRRMRVERPKYCNKYINPYSSHTVKNPKRT